MLPNHNIDKLTFRLILRGFFTTTKSGCVYDSSSGDRLDKPMGNYMRVTYTHKGKKCSIQAHRLLWMKRHKTLIPENLVINHKNGIGLDNRDSNHEVCTYGYNTSHALQTFGHSDRWKALQSKAKQGQLNCNAVFLDRKVALLRRKVQAGSTSISRIVNEFNTTERTVVHMLLGVTYSHVTGSLTRHELGLSSSVGRKRVLTNSHFEQIHKRRIDGETYGSICPSYANLVSPTTLIKRYCNWRDALNRSGK